MPTASIKQMVGTLAFALRASAGLAVNFQEVVHSAPAEEAEVADALAILGGTDWTFIRMPA